MVDRVGRLTRQIILVTVEFLNRLNAVGGTPSSFHGGVRKRVAILDKRIVAVLAETLHVPAESISDTMEMQNTESWDSIRHMELIAALERAFEIDLTFEEIVVMRSVKEIEGVLKSRGALT